MDQRNHTYCGSDAVEQKYMFYDVKDPPSKHVAEVPDLDLD